MNLKRARTFLSAIGKTTDVPIKASSVFRKVVGSARLVFDKSAIKNDLSVRAFKKVTSGGSKMGQWMGGKFTTGMDFVGSSRIGKSLGQGARTLAKNKAIRMTGKVAGSVGRGSATIGKALALPSLVLVGAAGMLSLSIMNGANNAANDIIFERYMADQRFSRDILLQSRLGTAMGTSKMNRYGSTTGLSNALSRTRHGASY